SREDLPAPLGPVTSSASPGPTTKLTSRKTSRPPLTQARSDARMPIRQRSWAYGLHPSLADRGDGFGTKESVTPKASEATGLAPGTRRRSELHSEKRPHFMVHGSDKHRFPGTPQKNTL